MSTGCFLLKTVLEVWLIRVEFYIQVANWVFTLMMSTSALNNIARRLSPPPCDYKISRWFFDQFLQILWQALSNEVGPACATIHSTKIRAPESDQDVRRESFTKYLPSSNWRKLCKDDSNGCLDIHLWSRLSFMVLDWGYVYRTIAIFRMVPLY